MIPQEMIPIQEDFVKVGECKLSLNAWAQGLVIKLLEATHGQWLYRYVQVHNSTAGSQAAVRKEEIQGWIEDKIELGKEGLNVQDHYLLEVNLEDLEYSLGEEQSYWLLQIQAARCEQALREANHIEYSQSSRERRRA